METKKIIFFGTGAVSAEFTSYLEDSKWYKELANVWLFQALFGTFIGI